MRYEEVLELCYNLLSNKKRVVDINDDDYCIYFNSKVNIYLIACPNSGNGYRWLFRRGKLKGFDRWANSTAEQQLYLSYKDLIKRLKRI